GAFRRCIERSIKKNAKTDVKVEGGTAESTFYGDESSDIGFKITASTGGLTGEERHQDLFEDIVVVRIGRSLGLYARVSLSEPTEFDTPTFDGLITSATGRLTEATGRQTTTATT